jgi:CHAD domain-containing protein
LAIKKEVETKLERSQGKMATRLAAYLDDPQKQENVHDARTSLRKLDAAFSLTPKKVREANSKYIKTYKEFFRANSRVRDCDVIKSRILSYGTEANSQTLLRDIEARRKAELNRAIKLGHSLEAMASSEGKGQKAIALDSLSNSKVEDRVDKVIRRLNKNLKKLLPQVLGDETKVSELHEARKDCKKLRYALDVISEDLKKPYVEKLVDILAEAGHPLDSKKDPEDVLHELQDLLGNVHDSDITIDFLSVHDSKDARKLLALERAHRKQEFQKFSAFMVR